MMIKCLSLDTFSSIKTNEAVDDYVMYMYAGSGQ